MLKLLILSLAALAGAAEQTSPSLPLYRIEDVAGGSARLTVDQKSVALSREQATELRKRLEAAGAGETAADLGRLRTLEADLAKAQDEAESVAKELAHARDALQEAKRAAKDAAALATAGNRSVRYKNSQLSQAENDVDRARERVETLEKSQEKARKEATAARKAATALRKDLATRTEAVRKVLSEAVK